MGDNQPRPLPTDLPSAGAPPLPPEPAAPLAPPSAYTPPVIPPPPTPMESPKVGEYWMAKSPAVNAIWEVCTIVANAGDPNTPLVQFPDGTVYMLDSVATGGKVSQGAVDPASPQGRFGSLSPDNQAFATLLLSMDAQSRNLFELPLDVTLTMVIRYAHNQGLSGSGQVGIYGGVSMFVPDGNTFLAWVEAYLVEVQRRQQAKNSPEI